uniref:GTP diphosphokinase n=1 Tax=Nicotiana tabacum TaxID=4097 RepID=A0A1S4AIK3_TOBAC|nr:PREDICTED: putative GTP diphosphokinase RSH1, chloroplastic isoform X1 [Nicotiana tabacum]
MASATSMSVSIECVNICKSWKGDVSGRFDCSVLSCAWKAPRALTGFLASTTHPSQCSSTPYRYGRRNRLHRCRCYTSDMDERYSDEALQAVPGSRLLLTTSSKWKLCCSLSFSSESCEEISPESLWEGLIPSISYLSYKELELVRKALNLAFEAHDGQKRRSGEPFIIHPVAVAQILGQLELDWESIAAGLLHDTVEDTNVVTFERIEKEFGPTVRRIVEGETKVSKLGKIKCKDESHVQDVKADDLRQMFLSMTEEVRVIIVKLADRLHNMRTLSHMPPHKQSGIATETLQVFAPLAKLLGIYQIKSELENLAFMYTNAQDYARVQRRIAELYKEHEKELKEAKRILMKKIEEDQFLDLVTVKTEIHSICKEPYSIYKAVLKSKNSINEVNQIAQLRIIIKPKPCVGVRPLCSAHQICYHVLGLVHGIWTPIPRAMKDYVATPKPNGYQSLHTTVIPFLYESMFRLEVQIRTEEMDLIAERGIAAHYSGKGFVNGLVGHVITNGRSSRGKIVCLNNANIALRV